MCLALGKPSQNRELVKLNYEHCRIKCRRQAYKGGFRVHDQTAASACVLLAVILSGSLGASF